MSFVWTMTGPTQSKKETERNLLNPCQAKTHQAPRLLNFFSSNGRHYGPIFFKPEKNLEFFRLKKMGP